MNHPNFYTDEDIRVLLSTSGVDNADMVNQMLSMLKKNYVTKKHPYAITQFSKGTKSGKWKTYVGVPRKEVIRSTEDALYKYLYDYYRTSEVTSVTFHVVFEEHLSYLKGQLNRTDKTISTYRCDYNRFIPNDFGNTPIIDITESLVLSMFASRCREVHPKPEAMKKFSQLLQATFRYAQTKHYCTINPANAIDLSCYYKDCDLSTKTSEEKEFSDSEIALLMKDAEKNLTNPRALMSIMARETGMRAAELSALRKDDISSQFLHIHRQQLFDPSRPSGQRYYDVSYTKDERRHPHDGRRFPINNRIQQVIDLAAQIPGDSDYLFHDPNSKEAIKKDGYEQYLSRRCSALGISTTNNHAFRMHRNSEFISIGLSAAERALLLGHGVETNERHYSLADKRLLSHISSLLKEQKERDAISDIPA